MKITIVAGARPNFIKIAPIIQSIQKSDSLSYRLVHTGQHYDQKMSDTFFEQLQIPEPDVNLACGGGTQAEQTAAIMIAFEQDLMENPTDLVLVVGDVTSTMACSITSKKLNTKVAHVEAGIRSFDQSMPEEINRMVTDSITDYFFTTSKTANTNLEKIGAPTEHIYFVGNVMIDTLRKQENNLIKPQVFSDNNLQPREYFVLTMHRPNNVDEASKLQSMITEIAENSRGLPIVFPLHPRTKKVFDELGINFENIILTEPLSYLEFNYLVKYSKGVITDSGGITEETTVYGVPCMTLRDNTERPETVTEGTNELVGTNPKNIKPYMDEILDGQWKTGKIPELWDGHAADRITNILSNLDV